MMKRREFMTILGGMAGTALPFAARAQQPERMRRIGMLTSLNSDDPEGQSRLVVFLQTLKELGWSEGRDFQLDTRSGLGDMDRNRLYVSELVALSPDVIVAQGSQAVGVLRRTTRTVPIVFLTVVDPVGNGFVESLARPGGNATGFTLFEYGISGKWLELLKKVAPHVTRAVVLRDLTTGSGSGQLGAIQSAASSFRVELRPVDLRDAGEIERAVAAFARQPNGGLIVTAGAPSAAHHKLIIALATRHRLPMIAPYRYYVTGGGLLSYGPSIIDQFRRAASYVDRILKGEKPADLPVQAPTKYDLAINLNTAKTLGLEVPPTLLALADEVIE